VAVALLVASCGTMHTAGPSGPMYQAAKRQWLGSGLWAGSAAQNLALPVAVRDLRMAESTDAGEKAQYSAAIAQLEVIEHMPDAMVSGKENAKWRAAQSALDRFFKVPQTDPYNLECDAVINKAATAAWEREPANATSGVIVGPLKQAVVDLEPEAGRDACYSAAIDDLTDLVSATKSGIAHSYSPPCDLTVLGFEIAYLDGFFTLMSTFHQAFSPVLTHQGQCQA
jgi:hypothetical protein